MSYVKAAGGFKSLAVGVLALAVAFGALAATSGTAPGVVHADIDSCEEGIFRGLPTSRNAIDFDDIEPVEFCLLIVKDAAGIEDVEFDFIVGTDDGDEEFELEDGDIQEISFAEEFDFVSEEKKAGWVLVDIDCEGHGLEWEIDVAKRRVEFNHETKNGLSMSYAICIFYNEPERQPDFVDQGGRFIGGGIFGNLGAAAENRARAGVIQATPQPAPASAPAIRAPSTGDGGLLP